MTEIQRLLSETIDDLNVREKRDNRPRFSISFIRKHPGLFIAMYAAWFATLAVMLQSETLVGSVWLLVVLFIAFNGFFFWTSPRVITITTSMCWTSGSVTTANGTTPALFPPRSLRRFFSLHRWIMNIKSSCKKWLPVRANFPSTIFLRWPAQKPAGNKKVRTLPGTHCFP